MANNGQILFLNKNHIDLDRPNPTITITDPVAINTGQAATTFLRNRDNVSGWVTTESTDAANTEIFVSLLDYQDVDFISLVKHNFKNYLVEYRTIGDVWNTYIDVVDNEKQTNVHQRDAVVNTDAVRITITGTMTADADKEMRQLIITEKKFQFEGWAVIKKPIHSQDRKVNAMLSGKVNVVDKQGSFYCELEIKLSTSENDLSMHEKMYDQREGLLLLLSGAVEDQFLTKRKGYRDEDLVLVKAVDEYTNPYNKGLYLGGIKLKMKLQETVF